MKTAHLVQHYHVEWRGGRALIHIAAHMEQLPMLEEALESRLKVIEEEIPRLTKLAAETSEPDQQDKYLGTAQDLQREARQLRSEIEKQSRSEQVRARPERNPPPNLTPWA